MQRIGGDGEMADRPGCGRTAVLFWAALSQAILLGEPGEKGLGKRHQLVG